MMIAVEELCKRRRIEKIDLMTPLLVPSFSSKGFPNLKWIVSAMKPYITDVAMISSYDVFHQNLGDQWLTPSLLFVDSGGYEARYDYDLSEVYVPEYEPKDWNRKLHESVLSDLDALSTLVFVSFDEVKTNLPLRKQIEEAQGLFERYPHVTSDFLVKPQRGTFINVDEVRECIDELNGFDLIGFTEKELGPSLADRLHTVARIRQTLSEIDSGIPIHVFGCLDPLTIRMFYLCGADVFDGLSWLRFAFHDSIAIYRNNWVILENYMGFSDQEARLWSWIENLRCLSRLTRRLGRYAEGLEKLDVSFPVAKRVLAAAGVAV